MSAYKRIFSGGMASIAGIGVVLINQLALVPIFLKFWSVEEFGVWLTVQALMAISSVFSFGYQTYWEFEFLKQGEGDRGKTALLLYSAIPAVILIASIEAISVFGVVNSREVVGKMLGASISHELIRDAGWVWLVQSLSWLIFTTTAGLVQRALVPYGYYPRNAWWYVCGSFLSALTSAAAVLMGANLLFTVLTQIGVYGIFAIILHKNLWTILKKEQLLPVRPNLAIGLRAVFPSLAVSVKLLLGMTQQQGIRILLAGALGARELATFATMRTVGNVALQGIGVAVNPMIPELIRYTNTRSQEHISASFGLIWLNSVHLMGFCLLVLQLVAPMVFDVWTLGRIEFQPVTFAILSIALLIFGYSQPMLALVRGNNIIRDQLYAAICAAIVTVSGIFFLVNDIGIVGAAIGILGGELTVLAVISKSALKWMSVNRCFCPKSLGLQSLCMLIVCSTGILSISIFPEDKIFIFLCFFSIATLIAIKYWHSLPKLIHTRVFSLMSTIMRSR